MAQNCSTQMTKQPTSVRLPDLTMRQLAELITATGMTQSEIIAHAIDRMYREEIKPMTQTTVRLVCSAGQDAYDAIAEAIKEGDLPANAKLGPRQQSPQGWFPKPKNVQILGSVTVRHQDGFYIVAPLNSDE